MHENRHFLSYRKRHHDDENHVHIYVHYVTLGSRYEMASNHRATDLDKIPFRISKDVGPLFISFLIFHLSRALLGAWHCNLFHSVYSSFHNRLDCIREPAFYFIFPVYPCLFHHICKNEIFLFVLVQQTSDFVASLALG